MSLKEVNLDFIDGQKVIVMDKLRDEFPDKFNESGAMDYAWFEKDIRPHNFIYVRHDKNSIAFTLQNGPIKEAGVNGCQVDALIDAAQKIIKHFNDEFPCDENTVALGSLQVAKYALKARTFNREKRGVEGTSNA